MSAKREFGVMKGQKVLVTGVGTGIGRGVAIEFSRAGADVVLHCSANSEGAESAAEAINSSGGCAKAIGGGFRDIQAVKETARLAIEIHAFTALMEHAVYAATNAAIVAYTRMAALELIQ
jgi:predicted dinucleotide-binding enzyme